MRRCLVRRNACHAAQRVPVACAILDTAMVGVLDAVARGALTSATRNAADNSSIE
jgi:hypothetical protein